MSSNRQTLKSLLIKGLGDYCYHLVTVTKVFSYVVKIVTDEILAKGWLKSENEFVIHRKFFGTFKFILQKSNWYILSQNSLKFKWFFFTNSIEFIFRIKNILFLFTI